MDNLKSLLDVCRIEQMSGWVRDLCGEEGVDESILHVNNLSVERKASVNDRVFQFRKDKEFICSPSTRRVKDVTRI